MPPVIDKKNVSGVQNAHRFVVWMFSVLPRKGSYPMMMLHIDAVNKNI